MNIREITNQTALMFLKENKASKEVLFYRENDLWLGAFVNDTLVGTIGFKHHKDGIHLDGTYVVKEMRRKNIATKMTAFILDIIGNKKIITYARPMKALINEKFGFERVQKLKNGTIKMIRYEN